MNHSALKKFAQAARNKLRTQIGSRLDYVLHNDDPYLRAHQKEKAIISALLEKKGENQLLEETAYIWFNRFTALRFMDNRGYNLVRIVSPADGESQPQLLSELHQGRCPREIISSSSEIQNQLQGRIASADPDREAYKTALLAWCNAMAASMPFLFRKIDDWAALLLPQDLLSEESVITDIQKAILPEDCQDVEIIGWLYQYYISEKKDEVFAGLKKNKKITREDIPAATQLFTPEWIVRYMVENSLGRLWLNNNPTSALKEKMRYFVKTDPEQEILTISGPEEIKLIDPCCGSGHILVYAFDLLYTIYEEEGYSPQDIPELILRKNLYGVDIDDRAASLAAFSVTMKALEKDRKLLQKRILPHVIAIQDVEVDTTELSVSQEMAASLAYLKDAKNLGSLIPVSEQIIPEIKKLAHQHDTSLSNDWIIQSEQNDLAVALQQLEYLSPRYHCVVTNPPYMGGKGMNESLSNFVKKQYPRTKSDLMTCVMERSETLSLEKGYIAMIDLPSWMFLSSFESYRIHLLETQTIISLLQNGRGVFGSDFGSVAFIFKNSLDDEFKGCYRRLFTEHVKVDGNEVKKTRFLSSEYGHFDANQSDFSKIPGSPIAYWVSPKILELFSATDRLETLGKPRQGLATGENNRFLRYWHEVSIDRISFNTQKTEDTKSDGKKWYPYNKGGEYRKWYGNQKYVVNWENDGYEIRNNFDDKGKLRSRPQNTITYFKSSISWSKISSGAPAFRFFPYGFIYDVAGTSIFPNNKSSFYCILGFCNSNLALYILSILSPTLNYEVGHIASLPIIMTNEYDDQVRRLTDTSRFFWNQKEESWDFRILPIIKYIQSNDKGRERTSGQEISVCIKAYELKVKELVANMLLDENALNRIITNVYGLRDQIDPEVSLENFNWVSKEINTSLLKNGLVQLEPIICIKNLISYAIGCLFGRYSPFSEGLILAKSQSTYSDYQEIVDYETEIVDETGILPITDQDDFTDDLYNQFVDFISTVFGDGHIDANLRFIENQLGTGLRQYFIKGFYIDHLIKYENRPVYWMISSPSGGLRALIYLHRYTRDTISFFLNDYLRPYQKKLVARASIQEQILTSGGPKGGEKTQAQKELDKIRNVRIELEAWERDIVYPMATQRIELDLDDGVKMNYGKLGALLEKVKGLNA